MRVLIISADGFEDSELEEPLAALRRRGVEVDIASTRSGPITGKHGLEVDATHGIDQVKADDYVMLVLPGGKAPAKLRRDERVLEVARAFFYQSKPVGAICHGPQILASAGLVEARRMTAYESVRPELERLGANVSDEPLVVDGKLFTSRNPDDLPAFTREMLLRLDTP